MDLNITLLAVIILTLWMMIRGFKKGMTKEITGLVALFAALAVLAIAIMIFSSFRQGETRNTVYSVILLVVFGAVYGIVKFILRSAKALSNLPIIHFLDAVLGIGVGFCKSVLIIWIAFLLMANYFSGAVSDIVMRDVEGNTFLKMLYEMNFFMK